MNTKYHFAPATGSSSSNGLAVTYSYVPAVPSSTGIFHKIGKFAGKAFSFFRKPETKITALISYWAVETVLFSLIMLSATTSLIFFSALFLYLYGTYALFSAAIILTK